MFVDESNTILVYNPISGRGHLDSWNAIFIKLLIQMGFNVIALTPDESALRLCLKREKNYNLIIKNLHFLDWNAVSYPFINPRITKIFCNLKIVLQVIYYRLCVAFFGKLEKEDNETERLDNDTNPVLMIKRISKALKNIHNKPNLIINMYMDFYSRNQVLWEEFDRLNQWKFSGISFVPGDYPDDPWYQIKSWRGMCLLDEALCSKYSNVRTEKIFCCLPDVTEIALPDKKSELTDLIQRKARGRNIVFLGGSISGQKNLEKWFELIRLANPNEWFFIMVGEIHHSSLTSADLRGLEQMLIAQPENFYIYPHFLSDEREFNEVISISQIIFAVYRNFKNSSNIMGKAAHFKKPILVSKNYLMGKRVQEYGIGLAVSEFSVNEMLGGLNKLICNSIAEQNFSRYTQSFSLSKLEQVLGSFIYECINDQIFKVPTNSNED